jgi:diacylglycerol kinase
MLEEKFSLKKRLLSFSYAWNGLKILIKEEHNARIHVIATLLISFIGFILKISIFEWAFIIFCIGFVFAAELINTAIEKLCNLVSLEKDEQIKKIKDLSAAAVLVSALVSLIIALIIILPKIII